MRNDFVHDLSHDGNRDGEAYAEIATGAGEDGSVDSDQVAGAIDQRTAGIARVDCGIGLDVILDRVDAQMTAPKR